MTVSARVDYACRALLELASRYESRQPVPLRQVTATQAIPAQFLAQILQQLKLVGLIQSTRGACGGYRLTRDPADINLWDVVVAMEGQSRSDTTAADSAFSRCLRRTWDSLSEHRASQLQSTTLQSLLDEARVDSGTMYYI